MKNQKNQFVSEYFDIRPIKIFYFILTRNRNKLMIYVQSTVTINLFTELIKNLISKNLSKT